MRDRAMRESDTIRSCPLCGCKPDIKENYTRVGGHLFGGVVCTSCGLAGLNFTTQGGIDMWQEMVYEWEAEERGDRQSGEEEAGDYQEEEPEGYFPE